MDQYAASPGHCTYPLSTSSIIAHHLDFMVQGKITEADALTSPHLDYPTSTIPHFTPIALSAATLPIYLTLGQAPNNAGLHTHR